jgi:hypothetical protein
VLLLVAPALVASVLIGTASARHAASSASFADPAGDGGGVDVSTVTVSSDDNGLITFSFTLPPALRLGFNSFLAFAVDADQNDSTGSTSGGTAGVDFTVGVGIGEGLRRWNGTAFETVTDSITRTGNGSITIPRSDLGNTRRFEFAGSAFGFLSAGGDEKFPDSGVWMYDLQLRANSLDAVLSPSAPRAGKLFQARDFMLHLNGGETVPAATVTCRAKLGTKALASVGRCRWRIPKTGKGKRLTFTMTGSAAGVAPLTRTVVLKVR